MTDMVKLGELIQSSGPKVGDDGIHYPVYSVTKHAGFVPSLEYFNKQVFSRDQSGYRLVKQGEFAYATIHLDEGSIGIAPEDALISPMYTVFSVDEKRVNKDYLLYLLKSPWAISMYSILGRGAIHRRMAISLKSLGNLQIPLPSLDEQRRIVEILDWADAIRAKRRHMLADFDELPRSLFERMFGNGDWNRIPLNQIVGNMQGGKNLVADDASAESVNRVLKISAVTSGHFRPEESKPLPDEYVPPTEHFVRDGDLLITRANTAEMVGAAVLVHGSYPHLVLPDKIWRFVWRDAAAQNPVYILWLLRTLEIRRAMSALSSGTSGSMKNISKAKLLAMNIPLPPISLQREFARRVEAIAAARTKVERALALDDELFASLQSRAFRGEL